MVLEGRKIFTDCYYVYDTILHLIFIYSCAHKSIDTLLLSPTCLISHVSELLLKKAKAKQKSQNDVHLHAAFESPRIDRVNEEKHILITTQLVHTTCNSKVSKLHEIVSLTLADDKMVGGGNPESVKSKKKLL